MATRAERKQKYLNLLGGKCVNCGSTKNLHFDHIDAKDKLFLIAPNLNRKEQDILPEVEKCQLLCEDCHKKKTHDSWDYGVGKTEHGSLWMYKKFKCRCDKCKAAMSDYYFSKV